MPDSPTRLTPRLYVVLALLVMLAPLATSLYVPGLPNLASSLDVSEAEAELTVSAALIGLAIGQLVNGSLSDRWGRRKPVFIGMVGFLIASLLCAAAPNLWVLLILRFVQGFAGSAGPVVARAVVRDLVDGRRAAQALSRLLMVTAVAPIIGPILGGQLLLVTDWRGLFLVLAGAAAISIVAALAWFPETLPADRRVDSARGLWVAMGQLIREREMRVYMSVIGLMGVVTFSWMSAGPFFFEAQYGMSAQWFAFTIALASVAYIAGAFVNSRLVMGYGIRRALGQGLFLMMVTGIGIAVTTGLGAPAWVIVGCAIANMGVYGGMGPNAQALALGTRGHVAGSVSALLGMMQFIGGAFIPPLITLVVGGTWAMAVGMAGASTAAFLVVLIYAKGPRRSTP